MYSQIPQFSTDIRPEPRIVPDPESNPSDTELVRRAQAGNTEAFDEIDRRYRPVLCRFLTRYALGPEQADEFGQQTLIRAFQMIGQLRSGECLGGWLHRIAFHVAAAEGRRRTPLSLDALATETARRFEPAVVENDRIDAEEKKANLWQIARRELSPAEFQVLELRYRDEISLSQIARIVGQTEGAVRVRLHRARKKLLPFFQRAEL